MILKSVGACQAAICATIANASRREESRSPINWTERKPLRLSASGTLGTVRCVRMKRRSAPVVSGSRSSIGLDSGGVIRWANCCGPSEIRMDAKSSASGRRSHIRRWPARAQSTSGEGWRHMTARRWASAAFRTFFRVWPR